MTDRIIVEIEVSGTTSAPLPEPAFCVSINTMPDDWHDQHYRLVASFETFSTDKGRPRLFKSFLTGDPIPSGAIHLGSASDPNNLWHVYELETP